MSEEPRTRKDDKDHKYATGLGHLQGAMLGYLERALHLLHDRKIAKAINVLNVALDKCKEQAND